MDSPSHRNGLIAIIRISPKPASYQPQAPLSEHKFIETAIFVCLPTVYRALSVPLAARQSDFLLPSIGATTGNDTSLRL